MRGPLDGLKKTWEADKKSSESVVSYVLSVREKLDKMAKLVEETSRTLNRPKSIGMIKKLAKESSRLVIKYCCYCQIRQVNC